MNNPAKAQTTMQASQTDAAAPQEHNLSLADIKALAMIGFTFLVQSMS
jgi:hypothetical protein